jgi:uroporphyrinogen-III synthase
MLSGWYVISLRPSGGHATVRRAAATLGARVLPVSTVRLEPLPAGAALLAALESQDVVFTSPAAVAFARAQQPLVARPGQRWLAVGAGTAAALAEAGIGEVQVPEGRPDADALLGMTALRAPVGRHIGVVTAPGGRGQIAETLAHRGAVVHVADVYRRVSCAPTARTLARLAALPATSALLVSSAEAFDGLWSRLAEPERVRLRARPAVASSPRLAARLASEGFAALVLADGAAPSALLAALAEDVGRGRFRYD